MNKIYYIIIINIISFILMGYDKYSAIKKQNRMSETSLLTLSVIGGSIGTLLGMILFHHKTKKLKFQITVPISLLMLIYICFKYI